MAKYEVKQNRLNDKQFIVFEAVASGRYKLIKSRYKKDNLAQFKAMQFSNGEVGLWVDVGTTFGVYQYSLRTSTFRQLALLKRLPVERELSFDELYDLVIQYV